MLKLVLALLIVLTVTPAEAAPVFGAIAAFAVKLAASFGGLLFKAALMVGSSLIQKYLAKRAQKKSQVSGITLELKMGDDLPMSFPVGDRAIAGRRKYAGTFGHDGNTPNAYAVDVIELSSLPSRAGPKGIKSIWVDDKKCEILWDEQHADGRGYPVQEFRKDGKDHLWIFYLDGTQTAANPFLIAKFGSHPDRPFTDKMIGRGCQAIIVTSRYNPDLFGGSLPSVVVQPMPTPFYDNRKDSTNGGSGPQRFDNPATWEPTLNPVVIMGHIIRGIYYGDEWVYGGQNVAAHRLPAASLIAAANECDRQVNGADGSEPQFRCGYEVYTDVQPIEVIEELGTACLARFAETGGIIKIQVGAPGSAVFFFDDSGIVISRTQDVEPFPSFSNTHNHIAATYPEPEERWVMKDAPSNRNLTLEKEDDDNSLPLPIAFEAVPYSGQVQRLCKTLIDENRRFLTTVVYLPPSAWALEPNDVVSWTSELNSYSNKKFIITRIVGTQGMLQQAALRELDPKDYTPPSIILPPVLGWTGQITAPVQPMYGWALEAATVLDEQGIARRPAVRISCAPDQDDVTHVHVQLRVRGSQSLLFDSDSTPYGQPYSWLINADLPANTWLEGRGRFVPGTHRATAFSGWLEVKTDDVRLGSQDITVELESTKGVLKEIFKEASKTFDRMEELAEQIALATAIGTGMNIVDRQVFSERFQSAFAQIVEEKRLRTAADEAFAQVTQVLTSRIDDEATGLNALAQSVTSTTAQVTKQGETLNAMAESLTGVEAKIGDVSASGLISFKVQLPAPNGVLSQVNILTRATDKDGFVQSGLVIQLYKDGNVIKSRVAISADQFSVMSPDGSFYPLVYENGELKLAVAVIGEAIFERLKSRNNKLVIRGHDNYADITGVS